MTAINYLFPPGQILKLPTWRFIFQFQLTGAYRGEQLCKVIASLKAAEWKIISFPLGIEEIGLSESGDMLVIPIEVPEERRRRPGSLADYESDVWTVIGNVLSAGPGFGEVFYAAIAWES
jgi:hypothetical protein